ncbi:PBP1A family penicillin-binding protein [Silicimonas algicola]|uniref:Penicillin-binding protein 1A n=1 Tax=Silicimonas algicola TaxID=1826607 RepID=A0A316G998_9RHOB|nr:PBP1A family penicillin-binding protein [Silicimonas algicola]AZQ67148.1 PBP1A family penicillin-binding protein [Silicimonas algicola]PWK56795.1 penicillin-binding protein 1A [Silicimonas algicola]
MTRFFFSFLGAIFSLVTLGLLMVALVGGAVFYVYGRDLPDVAPLANYQPPTLTRIYSPEGRIIDEYAAQRRIYIPYDEIPDTVKNAFISAEDKRFWTHGGFDIQGIAAALYEAAQTRGESVRGASTIPQQVAKIIYFGSERAIERKIKEAIQASRMVKEIGREKILEIYLNEIFLGQNAYGVAAAAQTYFNKSLTQLNAQEAAYLAALPKAPSTYHPVTAEERAVARRNFVLTEMYENGYIDEPTYEEARVAPLLTVQAGDREAFAAKLPARDYFTEEISRQLTRDFGQEGFKAAGLTIRATIDPEMQKIAAAALQEALEEYDRAQGEWHGTVATLEPEQLTDAKTWRAALEEIPKLARDVESWFPAVVLEVGESAARIGVEAWADGADGHWITPDDVKWIRKARVAGDVLNVGDVIHVRHDGGSPDDPVFSLRQVPGVQGGFMAMDVNTGRVIAMQGGFSYQVSNFNRATQALRQPGSSFKPFVYAAALDSGFTPATIIVDAPIEVDVGGGRVWRPRNASNRFYGPTPLRTGIERSRNLMTVRLAEEVGMPTVAGYAERFGVYDRMDPFLANSLGSQETTLFRMVSAYAMFANGGERVEPTLVDRVQDRWGTTIYRHDQRTCEECGVEDLAAGKTPRIITNGKRVMNPITAYQLTSMMRGVVERGTAAGQVNLGVPTAGKTGTTNDARDVWFVGFTSTIAAGCYIGYDQPRALGRGASGGEFCAPVFQNFMKKAVEKYGGGRFEIPPGGHFINIDRYNGARLPDNASGENVVAEYFREGEEPVFGIAFDGGFAMGANLPLYTEEVSRATRQVETSDGDVVNIPSQATAGEISSGGLY